MRLSADLPLLTDTELFKTPSDLTEPKTARAAEFVAQFRRDAIVLYSRPA